MDLPPLHRISRVIPGATKDNISDPVRYIEEKLTPTAMRSAKITGEHKISSGLYRKCKQLHTLIRLALFCYSFENNQCDADKLIADIQRVVLRIPHQELRKHMHKFILDLATDQGPGSDEWRKHRDFALLQEERYKRLNLRKEELLELQKLASLTAAEAKELEDIVMELKRRQTLNTIVSWVEQAYVLH